MAYAGRESCIRDVEMLSCGLARGGLSLTQCEPVRTTCGSPLAARIAESRLAASARNDDAVYHRPDPKRNAPHRQHIVPDPRYPVG
jgi:hypothetical protein